MNKKKLRYAIAKEIDKGNAALSESDFGVTEDEFDEAVRFLLREGYLTNIPRGDNRPIMFEGSADLTEKGEDYLSENSTLSKGYKGLKEIRDWLKM